MNSMNTTSYGWNTPTGDGVSDLITRIRIPGTAPHVHTALVAGPPNGEKVLLLHGFPGFGESWSRQLVALARAGYRAMAVDQRGYAREARPPAVAEYSTGHLVGDARAFARALGGDEPFHLVGHDWGGMVAWNLAAGHRERVASLTVLSTPHPRALHAALRTDPDQARRSAYILEFQKPGGVAEAALSANGARGLRRIYEDALPPALVGAYVARLGEPGAPTATPNWYRAVAESPAPLAGPVRVPTLYVWGDQDGASGRTAAESTGAWTGADYRFEVLPGAGHWIPDAHAEALEPLLLAHLAAHPGRF
ncbi:alpha/beta fold hydrolase [Streptomyces sp. NPDC056519]|uniref:alpha/beta fold hydrolase n=1 Tax=Streptomyces sp. NPDC056519 TaxID=3345849 RepID=UPI00368AEE02